MSTSYTHNKKQCNLVKNWIYYHSPSRRMRNNLEKFFDDIWVNSSNLLNRNPIYGWNWIGRVSISGLYLPNRYPLRCVQFEVYMLVNFVVQFSCTIVETVCTDQDNDLLRAFQDIDTFYWSIFNGFRFTENKYRWLIIVIWRITTVDID